MTDLRASDAERELVAERLTRHAAAGRLDPDELEQRLGAAYAARTSAELERLTRDLPAEQPPRPRRVVPRVRATPELRTYMATMALLVAIWALAGAGYFWPVWPALGWGAALMIGGGSCHRRPSRRRLTV